MGGGALSRSHYDSSQCLPDLNCAIRRRHQNQTKLKVLSAQDGASWGGSQEEISQRRRGLGVSFLPGPGMRFLAIVFHSFSRKRHSASTGHLGTAQASYSTTTFLTFIFTQRLLILDTALQQSPERPAGLMGTYFTSSSQRRKNKGEICFIPCECLWKIYIPETTLVYMRMSYKKVHISRALCVTVEGIYSKTALGHTQVSWQHTCVIWRHIVPYPDQQYSNNKEVDTAIKGFI